ncbi:MAG: hypothetical protein V1918_03720, partial [Planctomycetota bacterium]
GSEAEEPPPPPPSSSTSEEETKAEKAPVRKEAVQSSPPGASVFVFADVDFLSDMVAYQRQWFGVMPQGDNASLLFNTLDFLGGSQDLISIRTRGGMARRFDRVDAIEEEAAKATAEETQAINEKIRQFEERLNKLGSAATEENAALLQSAALQERRQIEEEIRSARKELRALQARRMERVETLGRWIETLDTWSAPVVILGIAVLLALVHMLRARRFALRRAEG